MFKHVVISNTLEFNKSTKQVTMSQTIERHTILKDYTKFWKENDESMLEVEITDDVLLDFFYEHVLPYGDNLNLEPYKSESPVTYEGDVEEFKEALLFNCFLECLHLSDVEKV